MSYGTELILDLHDCDTSKFNRMDIDIYFKELCSRIDMQAETRYFWDDVGVPEDEKQSEPHTKGTSAIQFILTSNITIHTLDLLKSVYVNIFSCKEFKQHDAATYTREYFNGELMTNLLIERR